MAGGNDVDVLIAGGGLVGASLARSLAGSPVRLALVEARPAGEDPAQPSFDDRTTALSPTSRRLFQALGLWDPLASEASPIRGIHVSEQGRFGMTRLRASDEGLDALGHVLPNRALGRVLTSGLDRQSNLSVIAPASVVAVEPDADGVGVVLDEGGAQRRLRARLVVAAAGSRSPLRQQLGLAVERRDYGQTGLVMNVASARDHHGWAFERFTREGPLAMLPLGESRCAVVWSMSHARAEMAMAQSDAQCLAGLQRCFGYRLGALTRIGCRHAYPLEMLRMPRRHHRRVLFVGNAARTLHPVAGQGFNLALRDVAELAERLDAAARNHEDPGSQALLAAFDQAREADERRVVGFTDGLVRLFSNALPGLALGRNAGLVALDLLPGLRRRLAHQAMGRATRLPRLSRGLPLREGMADGDNGI